MCFLGGFVQKCTLFRAAKQHIFADIAACYMKCAICHKIIRYIGIIYLSECDIWHMLCVKKLHTAIKSLGVNIVWLQREMGYGTQFRHGNAA